MGPLIFVARKHQIQRKKSQLNMRLMQIQNQREKIAEQIGETQKAKTARQNLFNSTSRLAQNSIMALMNIQNMASNYSANSALQWGVLGQAENYNNALNNITTKDGKVAWKDPSIVSAEYQGLLGNCTSEAQARTAITNAYNAGLQGIYDQSRGDQLAAMRNQLMLNGAMNTSNLFNNLLNTISNFGDEAELESLNAIDSQLEQEQTTVETQIKMLEAELQSVDKQLDNEIKQAAPKFSLGG